MATKVKQNPNIPRLDFSTAIPIVKPTESTPEPPKVFTVSNPSYVFGVGIDPDKNGIPQPQWMKVPTLQALGISKEIIEKLESGFIATTAEPGFVKSSTEINTVYVHEDGIMEVNPIDVMKLTQNPEDVLVINGGMVENGN
jgi:hypothetical protein